jgi:hypothetical protein
MPVDNQYPTPVIIDITQPSDPPAPAPQEPPPSGPSWLAKLWAFIRKYVIAPIPVLVLIVGAALLIAMGVKDIQIGGLLGKLLGKKVTEKAIDVANSIPPGRVREDGSLIPIGAPDSKGMTQAKVVAIEKPGIFSDPKTIRVTPPGATKPIEIAVPDGVKAKDIEHVVVVNQKITGVTVKNDSAVKAQDVDDLLAKYGK